MTSRRSDTEQALDAAGIHVTDEGRARARRKLDAARAHATPERVAAWRDQLGLPPQAAA